MVREFIGLDGKSFTGVRERQDELLVNGQSITHRLDGYKQYTVSRNDLNPWVIDEVSYLARSGSRIKSERKEPKEFTIKYQLKADSSKDLRIKKNQLSAILNSIDNISFKDETGYYFKDVRLSGSDNVEEDSNVTTSTFTLKAYDPHKYETDFSKGEKVVIDSGFVPVEEITLQFSDTIENPEIRIWNGLYTTEFRLVGTVPSGTNGKIKVHPTTGRVVTEGVKIALGTLPREFILFDGATGSVVGSPKSKVEFTYRRRVL